MYWYNFLKLSPLGFSFIILSSNLVLPYSRLPPTYYISFPCSFSAHHIHIYKIFLPFITVINNCWFIINFSIFQRQQWNHRCYKKVEHCLCSEYYICRHLASTRRIAIHFAVAVCCCRSSTCDAMDCSSPDSSNYGHRSSYFFFQGIFPTRIQPSPRVVGGFTAAYLIRDGKWSFKKAFSLT